MENEVKQKFNSYPDQIKPKMESLRELIYKVAQNTEGVGKLEETLKWEEPAYLISQKKVEQRSELTGNLRTQIKLEYT